MSNVASSHGEWKTIRISEPAYHKLLQLSSLMQLVTLMGKVPLSLVAEWAIHTLYDAKHSRLQDYISNPRAHQEFGKEIALGLKGVYDSRDEWKALQQAVLKATEESRKRLDTESSNASSKKKE